jgi:hypothetical protein
LTLSYIFKAAAFGKILPDQTIGIFVHSSLSRRIKRGIAIFAKDFSGHPARKNQQIGCSNSCFTRGRPNKGCTA